MALTIEEVRTIAQSVLDRHLEQIKRDWRNWPEHACSWTCQRILFDLCEQLPGARTIAGYWVDPIDDLRLGHTWIQWQTYFIDPTLGQFEHAPVPFKDPLYVCVASPDGPYGRYTQPYY